MTTLTKLALFAGAIGLAFGGAALAGAAISPDVAGPAADEGGHGEPMEEAPTDQRSVGHADARQAAGEEHGAAGLAVSEGGYRLVARDVNVEPGRPERFEFSILDDEGRPVRSFEDEHEREMHLIVVRRDTAHYLHLHPTRDAQGTWSVELDLPAAGVYRAYADFRLEGESHTLATDLFARGDFRPEPLPQQAEVSRAGGYEVTLESGDLAAGETGDLVFHVSQDGAPVNDVEPYLGALGHLVALREGDLAFLHVHPETEDAAHEEDEPAHIAEGAADHQTGEEIAFGAEFPTAGRYRLFLQFKHAGRVRTADYTVEVPR